MLYKGKDLNLSEYFGQIMGELGFAGNDLEKVDGYYRSEATYNTIAEYLSSCEPDEQDRHFLTSLGYSLADFEDEGQEPDDVPSQNVPHVAVCVMRNGDDMGFKYLGTFPCKALAVSAMSAHYHKVVSEWPQGDHAFDENTSQAFDGDMWDWECWRKWFVLPANEAAERWF